MLLQHGEQPYIGLSHNLFCFSCSCFSCQHIGCSSTYPNSRVSALAACPTNSNIDMMASHIWHTQQTVDHRLWSASKRTKCQVSAVAATVCKPGLGARGSWLMLGLHACIDNSGASDHMRSCLVVYNALQAINAPAVQ